MLGQIVYLLSALFLASQIKALQHTHLHKLLEGVVYNTRNKGEEVICRPFLADVQSGHKLTTVARFLFCSELRKDALGGEK